MSTFIVDKTELIASFLKSPYEFTAALYPRRFGKSTNLDMIRKFVEINYENSKDAENIDTSIQWKYFAGGDLMVIEKKKTIHLENV